MERLVEGTQADQAGRVLVLTQRLAVVVGVDVRMEERGHPEHLGGNDGKFSAEHDDDHVPPDRDRFAAGHLGRPEARLAELEPVFGGCHGGVGRYGQVRVSRRVGQDLVLHPEERVFPVGRVARCRGRLEADPEPVAVADALIVQGAPGIYPLTRAVAANVVDHGGPLGAGERRPVAVDHLGGHVSHGLLGRRVDDAKTPAVRAVHEDLAKQVVGRARWHHGPAEAGLVEQGPDGPGIVCIDLEGDRRGRGPHLDRCQLRPFQPGPHGRSLVLGVRPEDHVAGLEALPWRLGDHLRPRRRLEVPAAQLHEGGVVTVHAQSRLEELTESGGHDPAGDLAEDIIPGLIGRCS